MVSWLASRLVGLRPLCNNNNKKLYYLVYDGDVYETNIKTVNIDSARYFKLGVFVAVVYLFLLHWILGFCSN